MRVFSINVAIFFDISSAVEPSSQDTPTKICDIALRHEGLTPVESGSTRDTAPPATALKQNKYIIRFLVKIFKKIVREKPTSY